MHGCKVAGRRQAPPLGALLPGDKCSMTLMRDVRSQCQSLIMVPWLLPLQIHSHWPVRGSLPCIQGLAVRCVLSQPVSDHDAVAAFQVMLTCCCSLCRCTDIGQ